MQSIPITSGKFLIKESGVLARLLYSAAEADIIYIELEPNAEIKPHVTPVDIEFFVLEGNGKFILGEEFITPQAPILIPSPRGVPHGMCNLGPGKLRVLAIKNPRP